MGTTLTKRFLRRGQMNKEISRIFEEGAQMFGAKAFAEKLGIARQTLINYRKGALKKQPPHDITMLALGIVAKKKAEGYFKPMYNIRQNVVNKIGRPSKK